MACPWTLAWSIKPFGLVAAPLTLMNVSGLQELSVSLVSRLQHQSVMSSSVVQIKASDLLTQPQLF